MPEYHSGKKHNSGFSGEMHLGNYTSERMRLLREKRRGDKPELSEEEELQKLRDEFGKRIALSEQQEDAATSVEHHQRLEKKQSKSQYTPILLEEAPVPSPEQSITASVAVAKQAYQKQDYANAYELFTQIVNKQPDNYEALFHLGVSATETGNHNVAIKTTKKLIDSGHFTAQAFYFLGISLEKLGRQPEAAIAYQKAAAEIPEAHQAFMRLESERLLGGFSSKIASAENRGVTKQKNQGRQEQPRKVAKSPQPKKPAPTLPQSSKPSQRLLRAKSTEPALTVGKSSRSVREDTTFNQSGRPNNYPRKDTTSEQPRRQNQLSDSRRKDTTFNQSGNSRSSFNFRGKDIAPTILVKQGKSSVPKTATKAKRQLDVSKLVPVEKLAEAVSRSAKALPEEVAEELRALFTPATLATMVGVFALYLAAHATGIGQAMDIGMLLAGGIFFGLDAFTIFKDIAGFAGAVNATTEEELDQAGEHLASAVAKIGVDAVMTLLTKKVADEVGKGLDNLKQVDEVHAHHDPDGAGNLDDAEGVNAGQVNNVDNVRSGSNTSIEGRQSTESSYSSAIVPASPSGMSDNLVNIRSTLNDPRAVEAFDNMFGKMRGNSANMERAIEGIRKKGTDLEESMLSKWEKDNPVPFGASLSQVPDAIVRGQKLSDEVQAFKDAHPNVKGIGEWFKRVNGEIKNLNAMEHGTKEAIPEQIEGSLNNFKGVEAELRYAEKQPGVISVNDEFQYTDDLGEVKDTDVDVVADNGNTWIDNKNVKPFGLESSTWKGHGNKQGLKKQAEKLLITAQQNPHNGKTPRVVIEFPEGVNREVAQELQDMGVVVRGNIIDNL